MLIPMPPMPSGPPTEYAMSRRWAMLVILILQTVACVLRMVLLLDILGGFIMAIAIGFGWYAYSEGLHITFVCYWGMMSLINGAFDLVKLIDFWVKSSMPLFSDKLSMRYNVMSGVLLAVPIVTLAGCVLAWFLYKAHTDAESPEWAGPDAFNERRPFARAGGDDRPSTARAAASSSGFTAFEGGGHRLGAG
mmetsp:Transcript_83030/g.220280  ORF Transcript_83030/g.220280 Transcript_83030/m.220280 type:complete len:192 (-) Transcript_83030:37-612(-)